MTAPAELLFVSAGPQKVSPRVIHSFYWTQDVSKNWRECSFWHFALTLPSCFIHIPVGCKCNQASQWKHQNLDFFFNHLFWKMTYEKQQLSRDTDMKRITITSTLQGLNYVLKFSKCSFFFVIFFFWMEWSRKTKQNAGLFSEDIWMLFNTEWVHGRAAGTVTASSNTIWPGFETIQFKTLFCPCGQCRGYSASCWDQNGTALQSPLCLVWSNEECLWKKQKKKNTCKNKSMFLYFSQKVFFFFFSCITDKMSKGRVNIENQYLYFLRLVLK